MINGVKVQSHMIADSAFALDRTLLKPFPERPGISREESMFNYRLSRCRSSIERAFGMLKNRFRLLHKKMEVDLNNSITIIKAATVLHNICVLSGDSYEIKWHLPQSIHKKPFCNIVNKAGSDVRNALCHFFVQNPL